MKLIAPLFLFFAITAQADEQTSAPGSDTLRRAQYTIEGFKALGYQKYDRLDLENTEYRPIHIIPTHENANNPLTQSFLRALEEEKKTIMELYGLKNYQYNEMAKLALGILGNESKFFFSPKYILKENFPTAVRIAKTLKSVELNLPCRYCDELTMTGDTTDEARGDWHAKSILSESPIKFSPGWSSRGGTQIKKVPSLIKDHYGIKEDELKDPRKSAIATMGFLAQSAQELRWKQLDCVNNENFYDLVLYIYQGRHEQLNQCTATPRLNGYVVANRRHRAMFNLWEEPN